MVAPQSGAFLIAKKMDFKKIEKKWLAQWEEKGWYHGEDMGDKQKYYVLNEFPYPSGKGLHIGHAFNYTGSDVFARKKRMDGFNVIFPMGWDAFGLPTENHAIKTGIHPQKVTKRNTDNFRRQMKKMAYSFDWDREINTTDPDYYHWTQWIFIQLYKQGLAYKQEKPINWCPSCRIGLANEEVIKGKCERCGEEVTKKSLSQWIIKITEYADRLIDGLKDTEFIEKVKAAQINWIGRSQGAKIRFPIKDEGLHTKEIEVFTTRPDTLWGATFMVLAPEHDLVNQILNSNIGEDKKEEIRKYITQAKKKSDLERAELQKDKTGVFTGLYAVNPVNEKKIPIWISDFVLVTYGTGAIMAVPAHDERDFDFAQKFDLDIIPVIEPEDKEWDFSKQAYTDVSQGKVINSGVINGMNPNQAIKKAAEIIEEMGVGEEAISYHLRDWIFSRQHYWGEPIPMIHCDQCGWQPVDEQDLPIKLPEVEKYEPTETGESPLAKVEDWVQTECPKCGGPARRETDTMPNWAGSNWYYLAYCFYKNLNNWEEIDTDSDIFDQSADLLKYWLPVDIYFGGDEHNTLHLLYSRFIYHFLHDIGKVPEKIEEPYFKRFSHGLILGPDGKIMSKSRGNVVKPDEVWEQEGVDALRTYLMFMGPFDGTMAWNENAFQGVVRFLDKFFKFVKQTDNASEESKEVKVIINQTIKKVSDDIEAYKFNTGVAALMECINDLKAGNYQLTVDQKKKLVKLLAPYAPYLTEELWEYLNSPTVSKQNKDEPDSVHWAQWPKVEQEYLVKDQVEIAVQVNGKLRGVVEVDSDKSSDKEFVIKQAKKNKKVKKYLKGKEIKKEIFVPNQLLNFVVV
jgi:leucyl-tRNA synthetase